MLETLIIFNILLGFAVIALGVLGLGLARQIGLLHERSAPLGAMVTDKGPDIGDEAPTFELNDYFDNPLTLGGSSPQDRGTLLVFLAPSCPMCNKLLPTIRALGREERLDVVVVSDGPTEEHDRFLKRHHLGKGARYVVSADVGMKYQIGHVPYAVLLDATGVIRAKGLVNTREHLESLVEAQARNLPSLQAYLEGQRSEGEDPHEEPDEEGADTVAAKQ